MVFTQIRAPSTGSAVGSATALISSSHQKLPKLFPRARVYPSAWRSRCVGAVSQPSPPEAAGIHSQRESSGLGLDANQKEQEASTDTEEQRSLSGRAALARAISSQPTRCLEVFPVLLCLQPVPPRAGDSLPAPALSLSSRCPVRAFNASLAACRQPSVFQSCVKNSVNSTEGSSESF